MSLFELRLKPREERRLRAGHLWVYSNEVDTAHRPLTGLAPGTLCRITDSRGKPLGLGYVNPHALLCARLLTGNANATPGPEWFARRIAAALALRERLYPTPFYRLVFGESDGLPGLVVDRYGDVAVVQIATAGMENLKAEMLQGLQSVLKPRGILLRNDSGARKAEGLPEYVEAVGDVPDEVVLDESGVAFAAPIRTGQKTGWFYDQHDNRDRLARHVRGRSVLDVFSYVGGWAVRALKAGATSAACIDSSAPALALAAANARRNGVELETIGDKALDALRGLRDAARKFDVVVVDPPALVKKKKDLEAGIGHYSALNRAAMELLMPDGVLVSCSCSHHLDAEQLQRILLREARNGGRRLQILEQGGQGADHPVHPAIPETRYLKAFFCRVVQG
ncbi:MAG TPA: class I SAM-dependent rRNA methyltransferase [Candidatus Binatia bacterium]|nr:class I SAM-dependent rRNA methyltransferase [Candidatus Binatia bacterium]